MPRPVLLFCLPLIAGTAAWVVPARAQVDCADPGTQSAMNLCAQQAWQRADADLNAVYREARAVMRQIDSGLPVAQRGAEIALRDAQRSWITYRDAACTAEGFTVYGGSMQGMVVAFCLEKLTLQRVEDLELLAEQR